jgi:membrane associated rhomboid family serine protease
MNTPPQMSLAFPKPGRALWGVMIAMTALGVLTAFLSTWAPGGSTVFLWLVCKLDHAFSQPWRLITSGLLTDPTHWSHLAFSLLGLYFLGATLEKRWGGARFLRFLAISVVTGTLVTLAVSAIVPEDGQARFHPPFVFGPTAAITAIAVAWSREFADSTVNLFLFLPVRGRVLFWVTIGFCVLDLIYPVGLPEGVVAPFGGVIAGLVFAGTPSLARRGWLELKLTVLRRQAGRISVDDVLSSKPRRRPKPGAPPLRVVSGGLEDALKKRQPPKDKRYLN